MSTVPGAVVPRRRRLATLLLLVVLVVGGLLGGCARVRTALAIQPDDSVTGEMVIGTPSTGPTDKGPTVTLPPALAPSVKVTPYAQDGYVGSVLRFVGLSFDQVGTLASALSPTGDPVQFQIRRVGGRLLVTGAVDLTTVSVDRADFELKISFPGQVVETDGDAEAGTVSWNFVPGKVGNISATVSATDPHAPSVLHWSLGLAALVAVIGAAVVLAARRTRNPPVTPPVR